MIGLNAVYVVAEKQKKLVWYEIVEALLKSR